MLIKEDHLRYLIRERLRAISVKGQSTRSNYSSSSKDAKPSKSEVSHGGSSVDDKIDGVDIKRKSGANVKDLNGNAQSVIKYMYKKAKELGITDTPVITSGMRGPNEQASVMYNNWTKQGAKSGGKNYLIKLYADDELAGQIGDIFSKHHPDKVKAVAGAGALLKKKPISNHGAGNAFDLRVTSRIGELVSLLQKEKLIEPGDETKQISGPHWHIKVLKAAPQS